MVPASSISKSAKFPKTFRPKESAKPNLFLPARRGEKAFAGLKAPGRQLADC
jgi:hypothetical protein